MHIDPTRGQAAGTAELPAEGAPGVKDGAAGKPADRADAEKFGALLGKSGKQPGADAEGTGMLSVERGARQSAGAGAGSVERSDTPLTGGGVQQGAQQSAPQSAGGGGSADFGDQPQPLDGMAALFSQAANFLPGMAAAQQGAEPVSGAAVSSGAAVQTPAGLSPQHCDELVDRILVSQPAADGASEVRIKVNESWLQDTEIRLVKTPEGGLSVEFMTDDVDSQRLLMPNLSDLRGRLADRTGEQVTVRMTEQAAQPGDGQGGHGGQPGDGRSRNRRNLYEEMGDNT